MFGSNVDRPKQAGLLFKIGSLMQCLTTHPKHAKLATLGLLFVFAYFIGTQQSQAQTVTLYSETIEGYADNTCVSLTNNSYWGNCSVANSIVFNVSPVGSARGLTFISNNGGQQAGGLLQYTFPGCNGVTYTFSFAHTEQRTYANWGGSSPNYFPDFSTRINGGSAVAEANINGWTTVTLPFTGTGGSMTKTIYNALAQMGFNDFDLDNMFLTYPCTISSACTVASDQTICLGEDTSAFTSTAAASGCGTITYQWQSSTSSNIAKTGVDILGAASATYGSASGTNNDDPLPSVDQVPLTYRKVMLLTLTSV